MDGGYDEGYSQCPCFWGKEPGSLIKNFLSESPSLIGQKVLDLGCGEGKNANAFAQAGADVVAVDCSSIALKNGQQAFPDPNIKWKMSEAVDYLNECDEFDLVIMYGLLHCMPSIKHITEVVNMAMQRTRENGHHIVASFNNGPQELAAHPNLNPTLVPHDLFLDLYRCQKILTATTEMIEEVHPHNMLSHRHSITRLVAQKVR